MIITIKSVKNCKIHVKTTDGTITETQKEQINGTLMKCFDDNTNEKLAQLNFLQRENRRSAVCIVAIFSTNKKT